MAGNRTGLHISFTKGRLEKEDPYISGLQGPALPDRQLPANQLPYRGGDCEPVCLGIYVVSTEAGISSNIPAKFDTFGQNATSLCDI